jgi:hypothetical protein
LRFRSVQTSIACSRVLWLSLCSWICPTNPRHLGGEALFRPEHTAGVPHNSANAGRPDINRSD